MFLFVFEEKNFYSLCNLNKYLKNDWELAFRMYAPATQLDWNWKLILKYLNVLLCFWRKQLFCILNQNLENNCVLAFRMSAPASQLDWNWKLCWQNVSSWTPPLRIAPSKDVGVKKVLSGWFLDSFISFFSPIMFSSENISKTNISDFEQNIYL